MPFVKHDSQHGARLQGYEPLVPDIKHASFVFILGMQRSGTSCLAGSLERCGLFLGDVSRSNRYNLKGNHELRRVIAFHDQVLADSQGTWYNPPERVKLTTLHRQTISSIVEGLTERSPCGLKSPRLLLLADAWLDAVPYATIVGTFRHPASVARSLALRDQMPAEQAYRLWVRYNNELIRLHKRSRFPIIEFDLSRPEEYCKVVATLAVTLGLNPDMSRLRAFVEPQLDHYPTPAVDVPSVCQEAYAYLCQNRYLPSISDDDFIATELTARQQTDHPASSEASESAECARPCGVRHWLRSLRRRGRRLLGQRRN